MRPAVPQRGFSAGERYLHGEDIARTADENGEPGRYVTKDSILEIYDQMAEAIRTSQPYQTRLDPPSGPPTDTAGNFIPMAQWDPANWPPHIHKPKKEGPCVQT